MRIGGFQKVSLIDYPDHIASIVFTQGCPWRCQYCHNPSLSRPECYGEVISEDVVFEYLKKRDGKIDGVVVTGGEPTFQADLPEFLRKIKALKYDIKLDTNGSHPDMLKQILDEKLADYIAMDLKCDWTKYETVVAASVDVKALQRSMTIIRSSRVPYEWRTTVVPQLPIDPAAVAKNIKSDEQYFLQAFRTSDVIPNKNLTVVPDPSGKGAILKKLENQGISATWR